MIVVVVVVVVELQLQERLRSARSTTWIMAFKKTSSEIQISSGLAETGANTFTQLEVDLSLSPLDNEIFVVTAVDLDIEFPSPIAATNTQVKASVSTTSQTAAQGIDNSNVLASGRNAIQAAGFVDSGVPFTQLGLNVPSGDVDYIGIVATNNFFLQIQGTGNTAAKRVNCRVYGYRARADASTYAALVQSEVLSA
jgi:hypothetical protein